MLKKPDKSAEQQHMDISTNSKLIEKLLIKDLKTLLKIPVSSNSVSENTIQQSNKFTDYFICAKKKKQIIA